MTLDQFRDMAFEGLVVECLTTQERRDVLELFEKAGVQVSGPSRNHLLVEAEEDYDTTYMHPGVEPDDGYVSCFRSFERAKRDMKHAISYGNIQDLIEDSSSPLDNRSDAEFASDFASLIC